jgi:formylglycine-generating enzyme required for sulfatase activity
MAALSKVEAPEFVGWAGIIDGMLRFLKKPIYEKEDRSGGPGYKKIQGSDNVGPGESSTRYFRSIINRIPEGYAKGEPALVFDVSRQGNGTRIEVIRNRLTSDSSTAQGSFIVTYSSAQEFRRTLRANSLRLVNTLYLTELEYARDDVFRSTWTTSSALTELKTNVAVPNTFIQVKRPPAAPGEIPRGGFYMTKNQITQREWEALMGFNNSTVKGANLPVHIVSLAEAMEYCNRASLRDGLMPAYDVFFWEGLTREVYINEKSTITEYDGQTAIIRTNKYANGYRLPTADEWEFALTGGVGTYDQLVSELVKSGEITNVGWFEPNSNGRPQPVGQKRAINGFYDMLGNVTEYVFDGIPVESRRMGFMREGVKAEVRGGDYKNTIIGATDSGRGSLGETISLPSPTRREYEIRTWFKDGSYRDAHAIPGFRIVRPVFDYWAYRSGE